MKKQTLFLILLLSLNFIKAQNVQNYYFSHSIGSYIETSASATLLSSVRADDALSAAQNIGFNFVYDGNTYTQFKMSSNGFISFGVGANSRVTNAFNSSLYSSSKPFIAPLWDDLSGISTNSVAAYEVTGNAPNRVLTVEWRNWFWDKNAANFAILNPTISFQVKLYETTNVVEFIYRQESGNVSTISGGASIGIGSSYSAKYLNLTNVSNPAVSNSTHVIDITTKPLTGQIFSFSPCAPILAPTISSTASSCSSAGTSTISNYDASNTYSFTPSGPTVGVAGLISGLTEGISYTVIATNGGCSSLPSIAFSNSVSVSTLAPTANGIQVFCNTALPTVANLTATGTNIQWYGASTGGSSIASTEPLADETYYATQTVNSCESTTRTAVSVRFNDPQITASETTVCSGTQVSLTASTTALINNGGLPNNLQNGLVGYWPFNGNANDVSGNGNNGTVNGAILTTDRFGNSNGAFSFNGVPNRIDIGSSLNPNFSVGTSNSSWSAAAWINKNGYNGVVAFTDYNSVAGNTNPGENDMSFITLQVDQNLAYASFRSNGVDVNVSGGNISSNQWHHIAYTVNNGLLKLYVDGNLVAQTNFNSSFNFYELPIYRMGAGMWNGNYGPSTGIIDDVSLFSRALNSQEITQLYTQGQTTYLWSTGETSATINPSPTATTTYWCDVTVNGLTCRKEITITVNPSTNPTFNQVAAICSGATIDALPTTSNNGITGTWSPELNNTATTTYTFTPTVGQCANTTTMTIVVNESANYYIDADGDGIGAGAEVYGCLDEYGNLPPGYSWDNYDCNDNDANFSQPSNWYGDVYIDADGDGVGAGEAVSVCLDQNLNLPPGYSWDNYDCNDNDANSSQPSDWYGDVYLDVDGDGFGSGNPISSICMNGDGSLPHGYSWNNSDCDDHFFSSNGLCPLTLNVKLYLQGYYKSNQNQMTPLRKNAGVSLSEDEVDEITVSLYSKYDVINPIIATATAVVGTNGTVGLQFVVLPDEYFILVEHKNTIKTWSATPVAITNGTTYDFTIAASQAYGNNQIEVAPGIYAIYSGDMNQDGTINEADLPIFTTANTTAAYGYLVSDLNGDGSVDLLDYPIYKNNAAASVNAVRPVPLPAIPTITTTEVSNITSPTATTGGTITSNGIADTTARGVVWSTTPSPTIALATKTTDGTGIGTFTSTLTGLAPATRYYVRAYATNAAGTAYGNEVSFTTTNEHFVGELFGGGIVVSVWDTDGVQHGLIASLTDLSSGIPWTTSSNYYTAIGTSARSFDDGFANTNAIVAQAGAGTHYAAGLCKAYNAGGYTDWYLPAKNELQQCYNSRQTINTVLGSTNGFQSIIYYWSSTEDSSNYAWFQSLFIGGTSVNIKHYIYAVRAVRRF